MTDNTLGRIRSAAAAALLLLFGSVFSFSAVNADGRPSTTLRSAQDAPTAGESWSAMPNNGLNQLVITSALFQDDLYVGGGFGESGLQQQAVCGRDIRKDGGQPADREPHCGI